MSSDRVGAAAFDAIGAPLCILSADGTIRRSNDALHEMAGQAPLDGEHHRTVFADDAFATGLEAGFAGDETVRLTALETASGGRRPCTVTFTRLDTEEPLVLAVVERRDDHAEASLETREAAFREMYEVIAARGKSFDEQVATLLEIGCRTLGTRYGTLSHVEGDQYVFEIVQADDGAVEAGDTVPLSATVCERVVSTEGDVVIGDLEDEAPDQFERVGVRDLGMACYLGAPVFVDGDLYGTFCFYSDEAKEPAFDDWEVTLVDLMSRWVGIGLEQRRTEAELRRENERLERVASVISHDLRSPLSVAQGRLEFLAEEVDSEHLGAVEASHDRMEELITDILTLAREGTTVDETESVDLESVATDAWGHVVTDGATLVTDGTTTLRTDRSRLTQLFENLFRNCVEHAGADVTVTVGLLKDGFYVADDGPGIPADRREEVFDPGLSTHEDGTGFGLAIVREIAEAHDWTVEATESKDGGARFEIRTGDAVEGGFDD
ncbi:GAF domain-containing protein [Natronomonas halophila]|uniref:GAF domain-containing sensor histidine kinase n=1 Tax=Natronomonas halophila TaxID=2747817 RepID=UPI0015B4E06B|nr:ATP-binding protein [Natronomonas halophila]QLD86192.1 GAF domain-containing protein [Natronomonas halophila]